MRVVRIAAISPAIESVGQGSVGSKRPDHELQGGAP